MLRNLTRENAVERRTVFGLQIIEQVSDLRRETLIAHNSTEELSRSIPCAGTPVSRINSRNSPRPQPMSSTDLQSLKYGR